MRDTQTQTNENKYKKYSTRNGYWFGGKMWMGEHTNGSTKQMMLFDRDWQHKCQTIIIIIDANQIRIKTNGHILLHLNEIELNPTETERIKSMQFHMVACCARCGLRLVIYECIQCNRWMGEIGKRGGWKGRGVASCDGTDRVRRPPSTVKSRSLMFN